MRLPLSLAALLVAAAPAAALAHGGSYAPPSAGVPGGPGGPQVPPGTADPPAPATRWESWWASNKEYYLRLNEAMRTDDAPSSRGLTGGAPEASPAESREKRDAAVRESLAPLFIEALRDESFEVRTAAAIALGKSGRPEGSRPLREAAVKDKHNDVRDSAMLGLGLLGRPTDIPFLDGVLNDEKQNTRHRSFAAFSLGLIGGEDAAASLLMFADGRPGKPATFAKEQPDLVASVFVAMGMTCDRQVTPVLRAALASPRHDDTVRAFVVLSLGRIGDRESMGDIGRMLVVAKDSGLRRSAAIALGKIARATDVAAVEALVTAATNDPDEAVRHFAAISLGGMTDAATTSRLENMFPSAPGYARPFVALALAIAHDKQAAKAVRDALAKETDESAKAAYCMALGLLGDTESAPLVQQQLKDRGRVWLQGYAALALGLMRHTESAEMLYERLVSESDPRLRGNIAVALGLLHDPRAKAYLTKALRGREGSVYERGGAAMALGVLRMNEAVPDLADMWRDRDEQDLVRAFSVVALGLIADPSPVPKLSRFAIDNNYTLSVSPLNEVLSIL
jgi:HEAT repeat protein